MMEVIEFQEMSGQPNRFRICSKINGRFQNQNIVDRKFAQSTYKSLRSDGYKKGYAISNGDRI